MTYLLWIIPIAWVVCGYLSVGWFYAADTEAGVDLSVLEFVVGSLVFIVVAPVSLVVALSYKLHKQRRLYPWQSTRFRQ